MPRQIDHATRFAFLREAAFEVVLRQGRAGPGALSRRSVAAALGTSVNTVRRLLAPEADLVTLAADEVVARRRFGRLGRLRDVPPEEAALHQLRKCIPDTCSRVAEELVWLRLLVSAAPVPEDRDRDGLLLRDRFRFSEGRDSDDDDAPASQAPGPVTTAVPLAHHLQQREEMLTAIVADAVHLLAGEHDGPRSEHEALLRVILSGLALEVCLGALSPEDGVDMLARTVRGWPRLG